MDKFGVFAARLVPQEELFVHGHRGCQGCAPALAMRLIAKAMGKQSVVCNATGCMEIIASPYPQTAWKVPWIHVAFENAAAVASGVSAGIEILRKKGRHFTDSAKINVLAIGGDGGTMDIGIQALSGAMERGHDMVYICYDNEAYMNTGIQRSSGTPLYASTTTSPAGRVSKGQSTWKKDLTEIMVAHRIPYVGKASVSHPFDLMEKVKKACATDGPAFLHVFAPCPTGWRCGPDLSIQLADLAVKAGLFPLYEVEGGVYKLSFDPQPLAELKDYLKPQGRFRHLTDEDIAQIQERVRAEFAALKAKCQ